MGLSKGPIFFEVFTSARCMYEESSMGLALAKRQRQQSTAYFPIICSVTYVCA